MEKLLRLMNDNTSSFSLDLINFDSFSESKNWVGFFEKKQQFDINLIDDAIKLTSKFFATSWNDFFAISALSFDDNREEQTEIIERYKSIYSKAKNDSYLKLLNNDFENYLYGDTRLPISSLSLHFDNTQFMDICRLIMGHGSILGQVFFLINMKLNLALYPHNDIGFGVISFCKENKIGLNFLNTILSDNNFKVFIQSE